MTAPFKPLRALRRSLVSASGTRNSRRRRKARAKVEKTLLRQAGRAINIPWEEIKR